MLRNKKGFTLVELLAVIVILAIILAIAVPTITSITTGAKRDSFVAGVKMLIKGIDYTVLQGTTYAANATSAATAFGGSASDYGTITIVNALPGNTTTITVAGAAGGKFANCTVTSATFTNLVTTGTAGQPGVVSGC